MSIIDLLLDLQSRGIGKNGSLIELLQPMFAKAMERSRQENPVAENIALLTVLGTWASGQDISRLVPGRPRRPSPFRLKLEGRKDFAQHFLASAALPRAATARCLMPSACSRRYPTPTTAPVSASPTSQPTAPAAASANSPPARSRMHAECSNALPLASWKPTSCRRHETSLSTCVARHSGSASVMLAARRTKQVMDEIERRISACSLYQN